jgi:hypothetical protein
MTSTSKLSGNVLVSLPMWGLLRLSDGASYPEFGVRPFLAELQMRIMQLAREGSPPPRLRLPQAELSRKSNQIACGRIRRFESDMPSQAVSGRHVLVRKMLPTLPRRPRGVLLDRKRTTGLRTTAITIALQMTSTPNSGNGADPQTRQALALVRPMTGRRLRRDRRRQGRWPHP